MESNSMFEPQPTRKGGKGRVGSLVVLLLVVILFAVTNPSTTDFSDHMVKKFSDESDNVLTRGVVNTLGRGYIEAATQRSNYVLFSTFTMTDGELSAKYIGLLNGIFIQLSP